MNHELEISELRRSNDLLRGQIEEIWALLRHRPTTGGGGTLEAVTLTLNSGNGGTSSTPATFTYNFTTSDNVTHTAVSPSHNRLFSAIKASTGVWDTVNLKLVLTDEEPDGGSCATT